MKTTWRLMRKDFAALRYPLLLWLLVCGGAGIFSRQLLAPAGDHWWARESGDLFSLLYLGVTLLIAHFLVAAIALEDPVTGSEMFWATRPIGGRRLLGAKLGGIGCWFVPVPVLCRLPWWLHCGYDWPALRAAAGATATVHALVAGGAFTLAALTGQSSRFLLASALLVVALFVASVQATTSQWLAVPARLMETRVSLGLGALLLASGGLVWQRYHNRRILRGNLIFGIGLTLAGATGVAFPWAFPRLAPEVAPTPPGMEHLVTEVLGATGMATRRVKPGFTMIKIRVRVEGLPAEFTLLGGRVEVELRWADGTSARWADGVFAPTGAWDTEAVQRALAFAAGESDAETARQKAELLGGDRQQKEELGVYLPRPDSATLWGEVQVSISRELLGRLQQEAPACAIRALAKVGRPVVLVETPLREHTQATGRNVRLHFHSLRSFPGMPKQPPPRDRERWSASLAVGLSGDVTHPMLFALNRRYDARWHRISPFNLVVDAASFGRVGFAQSAVFVPTLWSDGEWKHAPDWQESATVAVVGFQQAGEVAWVARTPRLGFTP